MTTKYQSLMDLMPSSEKDKQILRERAEHLSRTNLDTLEVVQDHYYVRFKLGDKEYYGIPFQFIKEVLLHVTFTKVPNTPPFIAGIINRNGALISILDLKPFFHIKSETFTPKPHLIVITVEGITCAILADSIENSCPYNPNLLEPPLVTKQAIKSKYLFGLDKGITPLLNPETLLPDLQFKQSFTKEDKS